MSSARPSGGDLLRLAVTPKWLGLLVALGAFIAVCVVAGQWQWARTQEVLEAERAAQSAPIPVEDVAGAEESLPNGQVGRPVVAVGEYLAEGQARVLHRSLQGEPGIWVLTPMRLADGSIVGIVRGWLASDAAAGIEPPQGTVTVTGVMHPDEKFYPEAELEPGTAVSISSAREAERWGSPTRAGYVVLSEQDPALTSTDPRPVPPTVNAAEVDFPLRNFGYALQWFVFALFAVAVYVRWLWLDAVQAQDERAGLAHD